MTDFTTTDYFSDESVAADTYPYFDFLLEGRRVWREPYHGVVMVAGHAEVLAVMRDTASFSNINIVAGPNFKFPVELTGENVTDLVDQHRDAVPMGDQIITFDPPKHTAHRGLLMGLITPKRLKENEEFMWRLADRQLDAVLPGGQCEFIDDFAQPYTLLVIADLLGVPESDHPSLLRRAGVGRRLLGETGEDEGRPNHPLDFLYGYFTERIEQLRRDPRGDVLTGMARATFPDGSMPEPVDVARIAANLFSAGQETTVRLLSTALRLICDEPGLQQRLREHRELIPRFIEETLRIESPIKGAFRLALKTTTIGGVEIPAGSTVMLLHGAANRDPRMFEDPDEFRLHRANARHHMAFGRGIHTCPGAPLVRAEGRVAIECLLARTSDIRIPEKVHGPAGARRFRYMPSFVLRGLADLTLEFEPVS
jgi:cytochrome P450